MSSRPLIEFFQDILDEINSVEEFISDISDLKSFEQDKKTIYAVTRAIEIIGEAVKSVPQDVRRRYQDIPWKSIAGMRDKSIHDYWSVDVEVLWRTAKESIPELKVRVTEILDDLESS
jgi:uncharacterized protein with HEPN domain